MRSQKVVADWFRNSGWHYAESAGAGRPGIDILGMPGLAPEVKARRLFNMTGFLKQAVAQRKLGLPFVVIRPDGYGETRVGEWAVLMTLADFTDLVKETGYHPDNK